MLHKLYKFLSRFCFNRQTLFEPLANAPTSPTSSVIPPSKLQQTIIALYPNLKEEDVEALAHACEDIQEVVKVLQVVSKTYLPVQTILNHWEFYKNV